MSFYDRTTLVILALAVGFGLSVGNALWSARLARRAMAEGHSFWITLILGLGMTGVTAWVYLRRCRETEARENDEADADLAASIRLETQEPTLGRSRNPEATTGDE